MAGLVGIANYLVRCTIWKSTTRISGVTGDGTLPGSTVVTCIEIAVLPSCGGETACFQKTQIVRCAKESGPQSELCLAEISTVSG